ncbi:hypothetical protein D1227_07305 [Henriciella mobilis]|uniref:sulfotransferase family 2 domain-containing protein n=1 Tax=Henriciella mobilis TaxID=2305467 RepID=UPI000E671A26|nr:sulfotransferase family 2 domain-containing protein [Henriciella mobilis]RIJ17149.1 hypothetical protein D1231_05905 [Henriciella mobilis]RIJ22756.1 hypothetical protein D1227_07305 [Henriciella mobilis]
MSAETDADPANQEAADQIKIPYRIPLYHNDFPFVIMWSEKSGCTSLAKWFFWQVGLLEEATAYHPWVHNYENEKFKARRGYLKGCLDAIAEGKPVIKFVRNPYRRAFSGYLELCNPKIVKEPHHWTRIYRKLVVEYVTGYAQEVEYTFTFRQFVDWLVAQRQNTLDLHLRQQFMTSETNFDVRVHQIEAGQQGMNALEAEFGLQSSAGKAEMFESRHHHAKTVIAPRPAISIFDAGIPVRRSAHFKVVEPTLEEFATDPVGAQLRKYFVEDFVRYGYL